MSPEWSTTFRAVTKTSTLVMAMEKYISSGTNTVEGWNFFSSSSSSHSNNSKHFTHNHLKQTPTNQHSFKMQFLAIVSLALAGLASAASIPEKRASTPEGCASAYYNDGSDGSTGGWGCAGSDTWGNCQSYYWKESPPFWSVSKSAVCNLLDRKRVLTIPSSTSATRCALSPRMGTLDSTMRTVIAHSLHYYHSSSGFSSV